MALRSRYQSRIEVVADPRTITRFNDTKTPIFVDEDDEATLVRFRWDDTGLEVIAVDAAGDDGAVLLRITTGGVSKTFITTAVSITLTRFQFGVIVSTPALPAATITLPLVPANAEEHVIIRSGAHPVTVDGNGTNILGQATGELTSNNESWHLVYDGLLDNEWKRQTYTPGGGGGETNTVSNIGAAGVGVYKQKTGVDFELKKINAGSTKVTITDDALDNEIDVDIDLANIKLDDLAATDDNTDLDASTVKHGLLLKLGGGTTNFLRADGTWSAPGGGGGSYVLGTSGADSTVSKGSTDFIGLSGGVQATETSADFHVTKAGTMKNLYAYVSANASNNAGNTMTVRLNGVDTALTVTWGASTTGVQSDTVNTVAIVAGDKINFKMVNAASGGGTKNIVLNSIGIEVTL